MAKDPEQKKSDEVQPLHELQPNAAGIDIGATEIYVAVPAGRSTKSVRRFLTFTDDLHEAARWLKDCGIESIAMESTGVYWIPVFQILDAYGFEVSLVNTRHVKNVRAEKPMSRTANGCNTSIPWGCCGVLSGRARMFALSVPCSGTGTIW